MSSRVFSVFAGTLLALSTSAGVALAHAYPKTTDPQANARLDGAPTHIGITYDSPIDPRQSPMALLDSSGSVVPATPDVVDGTTQASISPTTDLVPGPYTLAWTSYSAEAATVLRAFIRLSSMAGRWAF